MKAQTPGEQPVFPISIFLLPIFLSKVAGDFGTAIRPQLKNSCGWPWPKWPEIGAFITISAHF
jgi:hypothetical protein